MDGCGWILVDWGNGKGWISGEVDDNKAELLDGIYKWSYWGYSVL